jgi:hypothetical protein
MNNIDIFVLKHLPGGGTWDPANPSLLALPSNIRLIWKCLLTNIITQFIVLMLASVFDPGKYLQPSRIFASKKCTAPLKVGYLRSSTYSCRLSALTLNSNLG